MALAIGYLDYGGDVEAVYAPVFGDEPAENAAPAPMANIAGALEHMTATHPELTPTYVIMHEPGTEGQHLQILAEHPNRLIFGDYYEFDADGRFLDAVGMADGALGRQLAATAYRLHFGSFGGLAIKAAYAALGLVLAHIIGSGMNIYFLRQRERGRPLLRLRASWIAVVWGAPLALSLTMLGGVTGVLTAEVIPAVFWSALGGLIVAGMEAMAADSPWPISREKSRNIREAVRRR